MREADMRRGSRELERGMRELARHRPDRALKLLREAVDSCPASRPAQLSARLYWLSVALLRLDRPELALKSLASAQKLRPRGFARSAYAARSNEYGMPRRAKPELDDFYAFYSVQAEAYFARKGRARFDDSPEKDAVVRLIGDAWLGLSRSGKLRGLDSSAKLRIFRELRVDFPSFAFKRGMACPVSRCDFRSKRKLSGEERCHCGSGLPYRQCCGRTASPRELASE